MKRDLSNIASVHKIYECEKEYCCMCFMCLGHIIRGTFIVTFKERIDDEKSKNGIVTRICDGCLSIIISQKIHDYDIDATTIDYFEDMYDEASEITEKFKDCIENEAEINIKGKEYILINKDLFDDFSDALSETYCMKSYIVAINAMREGNK